ncbi:hypothetical protein LDL08_25155 [Nonomuraea glycinis]|uniref:hypothetical protein n=1 Tax=Nonomuraea glycinis TaxID=2047744 RepID=UPI001668939F|nr:hypothetical protein [Nonomuraea glycinis]MCA2179480.1 hypothetical protein [Nonomuraea glycinis]
MAILAAAAAGAAIAAPHIKSWWQEKAFPSLKRRWARKEDLAPFATDEGHSQAATAEPATLRKTARADFSNAIDWVAEQRRACSRLSPSNADVIRFLNWHRAAALTGNQSCAGKS